MAVQMRKAIQQDHISTQPHGARQRTLGALMLGTLLAAACGVSDEGRLPPEIPDPSTVRTPAGALARYRATVKEFASVFDGVMFTGGVLTDELAALPAPLGVSGQFTALDSRQDLATAGQRQSARLHHLRAQAREGRGFLGAYASESSPALRGHLYALEAYAELFLADLFCSGIPLSTVDFDGDYTLAAGSSTAEVYRHAVGLFDSAQTLVSDSAPFPPLVALGRGRGLLALGRYAEAAAAVAAVADNYRYQVSFGYGFTANATVLDSAALWFYATRTSSATGSTALLTAAPSMASREGVNGLDYRTSGDPRTAAVAWGRNTNAPSDTFFFPAKYSKPAVPPFSLIQTTNPVVLTVASGVEARLVEAEAALQGGSGDWLTKLNTLRTDGTFTTQPTADPTDDPANVDTLWNAGGGGVARLRPLEDPGSPAARVDLLFRERAFWLYLAGYRQGDLRRLIRQYGRQPEALYPTGLYRGGVTGFYGTEIVIPVLEDESNLNPQYTGCFHRDA